jgi:hypothetical protein
MSAAHWLISSYPRVSAYRSNELRSNGLDSSLEDGEGIIDPISQFSTAVLSVSGHEEVIKHAVRGN